MKLLLTSAGIKNASIHDALVELLGKPIAESDALCIPTALYGHPMAGPRQAWRCISGQEPGTPTVGLGWKSMGVLELTALPSLDAERWVPLVRETDVLLVEGGDAAYLCHWMRAVRPRRPPAVAARDGLGGRERRKHGDDPSSRGGLRQLAFAGRRQNAGRGRFLDLPAPRKPGPAVEHHGHCRTSGRPACRGLRTRSTTRPPSKWSTAPSKSSPRGTGNYSAPRRKRANPGQRQRKLA